MGDMYVEMQPWFSNLQKGDHNESVVSDHTTLLLIRRAGLNPDGFTEGDEQGLDDMPSGSRDEQRERKSLWLLHSLKEIKFWTIIS